MREREREKGRQIRRTKLINSSRVIHVLKIILKKPVYRYRYRSNIGLIQTSTGTGPEIWTGSMSDFKPSDAA